MATPQESIDYFVNYIEEWRKEMHLDRFYLAAHSFGGYICGNYALKYHQHIIKLVLMSPIGIRVKSESEDDWKRFKAKSEEFKQQGGAPPSPLMKMCVKALWKSKTSPFSVARLLGLKQTKLMIEDYLCRRQGIDDELLLGVMSGYIYQLLMSPSTSECSLMVLLSQGLQANLPLGTKDKLANPEFPIGVSFIYGQGDWMRLCDDDFGKICIDAQDPEKGGKMYICPNSGHNLQTDNPVGLANLLAHDLLGKKNKFM